MVASAPDPGAVPRDTRAAILDAARSHFLRAGYEQVTLRAVAEEAAVDVALIGYHFGSKHDLFLAALAPAGTPGRQTAEALAVADRASLPARLLEGAMRTWEEEQGPALLAILEASVHHPEILELVTSSVESARDQLAVGLAGPHAKERAAAYTVQITGLMYSRYVLRVEPLASMAIEEVVGLLVPGIAATLNDPCEHGSGAVPSAATVPDGVPTTCGGVRRSK